MEYVVLVDEDDRQTGTMEKILAHEEGKLHRAISVFIFNSKGELLLQQRARSKYHSSGLWTNTCCSHPRPGESVRAAAQRRIQEEMGITCSLDTAFSFTYKAALDNGLTEHELDHVFTGTTDAVPLPDGTEVAAWKYIGEQQLEQDIKNTPQQFTEWFKICFDNYRTQLFQVLKRPDEGI